MEVSLKQISTASFGLLIYLVSLVEGGEYCGYYSTSGYYTYSYCNGYCCANEYDHCCTNWGWVAGVVVGAVVFFAVVGVLVFMFCAKIKTQKTRTVHVEMQQRTHQPYATNNTHNYNKPRRAAPPQYPAPPPPYTDSYNYGGGPYGNYPPPPPYTSPLPGSSGTQTTSLNSADPVYPPPAPVS